MKWLWAGWGLILATGAVAAWFAWSDPTFYVGLFTASMASFGKAMGPWLKKLWLKIRYAKGSEEQRRRIREGLPDKEGGR